MSMVETWPFSNLGVLMVGKGVFFFSCAGERGEDFAAAAVRGWNQLLQGDIHLRWISA